jgi:MSHA pilin protein MshA
MNMSMSNRPKNALGFTLIELIVVIVILGVLAVTAAPKYMNFSSDARIAALQAFKGTIDSTMNLTVAAAQVKSTTDIGGGFQSLQLDGDTIFLTPLGYPLNWHQGLKFLVNVDENDWVIDPSSLSATVRPKGMVAAEDCYFQYDATATAARPVLSLVTLEC